MQNNTAVDKELRKHMIIVFLLTICLVITTIALALSIINVNDNKFATGSIKINLNDGKPVIEQHEFLFEPGMTVEKDFFIKNEGTFDVYYRLYLDNIEGNLKDVLEVTVLDGNKEVYKGKSADFTRDKISESSDVLKLNQKKDLKIRFYFPTEEGNVSQSQKLTFELKADAVQTKNNDNREFE